LKLFDNHIHNPGNIYVKQEVRLNRLETNQEEERSKIIDNHCNKSNLRGDWRYWQPWKQIKSQRGDWNHIINKPGNISNMKGDWRYLIILTTSRAFSDIWNLLVCIITRFMIPSWYLASKINCSFKDVQIMQIELFQVANLILRRKTFIVVNLVNSSKHDHVWTREKYLNIKTLLGHINLVIKDIIIHFPHKIFHSMDYMKCWRYFPWHISSEN
jgi:hypothetical protein